MIAAARRATKRVAARIPGSQPMLRTSRPCAVTTSGAPAGERADQPGRNEEVRVDDVGLEAARRGERRAREPEVLHLAAAAPIENRALDLVAARDELLLEPAHEHAEVGVGRPGVHLGDEQDPHRSLYSLAV